MGIWDRLRGTATATQLFVEGGSGAAVFGIWLSIWFSNGDPMIIIGAVIFAIGFGALGLFTAPQIQVRWKWIWLFVITAVSMADGYVIYLHLNPVKRTESVSAPLNGTIGIMCGPTTLPETGAPSSIAFLEALPPKPSNVYQLGFGSGPGGPKQKWSRDGKPLMAWHCTITNYGPTAVSFFQVVFHEEYRTANAAGSCAGGSPDQTYDRPASVYQLGIGRQEAFHFYVWNAGQMCASVYMPTKAKVWNAREQQTISFDLLPPNMTNVVLGPTH